MSGSGKKKGKSELGRAILKERNRGRRGGNSSGSWLHTSELDDGYDWNKLNLRSVTEESRLDEFLRTAELAGTEFTAEKLNIRVVDPAVSTGLPTEREEREIEETHSRFRQYIGIPRRPQWDSSTTPDQLEQSERDSFLTWRRNLARLEEKEGLLFTPFEKNLEFWRQLWRVIERSDVVVQIVDARNPLLFRCEDLEKYVKELSSEKANLLLISKADLLTPQQRRLWAEYFSLRGVAAAFWSAEMVKEEEEEEEEEDEEEEEEEDEEEEEGEEEEKEEEGEEEEKEMEEEEEQKEEEGEKGECEVVKEEVDVRQGEEEGEEESRRTEGQNRVKDERVRERRELRGSSAMARSPSAAASSSFQVSPLLLSRAKLLQLFLDVSQVPAGQVTTVGLVGYPNVGKSTTINVLYREKKVPVSATPGRTKHFQTLYISDRLMLCDCPGLVFPSLVSTKAEMIVSGILSIDQMRNHTPPVSLVCQRIPRQVLEQVYGLSLPSPGEGEDPHRPPHAQELLNAYGYLHGYMTSHGVPDCPRSARYILKDYVKGKLLFCHPPPRHDQRQFNNQLLKAGGKKEKEGVGEEHGRVSGTPGLSEEPGTTVKKFSEFDRDFFHQEQVRAISKGTHGVRGFVRKADANRHHTSDRERREEEEEEGGGVSASDTASVTSSIAGVGKPWKKHHNRNKREKTRRSAGLMGPYK